jgi:hypothetical protein
MDCQLRRRGNRAILSMRGKTLRLGEARTMRNFVSRAIGLAIVAASAAGVAHSAGAAPLDAAAIAAAVTAASADNGIVAVAHRSRTSFPGVGSPGTTYVAPTYDPATGSPFGSPFGSRFGSPYGAPGSSRYGSYSGGARPSAPTSGSVHQYQFPE